MKTSLLKTHKIRIIQKELVHGFRKKIEILSTFLSHFQLFVNVR